MAVSAVVKKRFKPGNSYVVIAQLTLSGNYVTGGDSFNVPNLAGYTNRYPDMVIIEGISGYLYRWVKATNKVLVFGSGAAAGGPLSEFTSGAYSAALTGDTIIGRAEWATTPQLPTS